MGEWIAITSVKDGVGKTTAASYLGLALSAMGHSVIVLDLCPGEGGLQCCYHYEGRTAYHYVDVFEGNCRISDAMIRIGESSLYALPGPKNRRFLSSYAQKIPVLARKLAEEFDFVLLDVPPAEEFRDAADSASLKILLATPNAMSVSDTVASLKSRGEKCECALLMNRIPLPLLRSERIRPVEESVNRIGLKLIGAVPEDPDVYVLPEGNELPKGFRSPAEKAFYRIARRLSGENVPILLRGR